MSNKRKKTASGATIPEAVRAARGTGQVVSVRLAPAVVARLDDLRESGESRADVLTRLVLESGGG